MQLESYLSIGKYNSLYNMFRIILKTEKVLNRLFDLCFSVILHVLIVSLPHLPNTSSTITQSSNASVEASDNILSVSYTHLRAHETLRYLV